jgi:1-pyrroline-5-carboxylate dehydrogenase
MTDISVPTVPVPKNEPCKSYAPGSPEALLLRAALDKTLGECPDIPIVINGREVFTEKKQDQVCPADHKHVLCRVSLATPEHVNEAIDSALKARSKWESLEWTHRIAIFLKAADLIATKYRYVMNAACMLGQGKTIWQAEIDSACEAIDFLRFNSKYIEQIYQTQPQENSATCWNRVEYRPLEGFIWALTPFNFTAIGLNLAASPAMMGNVVVWKPSSTAVLSNYLMFKILKEAGLPDGVINFLPGSGAMMSDIILSHRMFAGLHFTGSTEVFNGIQRAVGANAGKYFSYPRIVGETGGKDFHFVHESADIVTAVNQTLRGAFEFQGQKCSACSRVYIPDTKSEEFLSLLEKQMKRIKLGKPEDFSTYVSAVIDKVSFDKLKGAIEEARTAEDAKVLIGGTCDDSVGYMVEPTVILTTNPRYRTMGEELFGPVLTVHVYEASKDEEMLRTLDETSPYALTGAIFARDVYWIQKATRMLRNSAGNFYINDKCTGAVVGQQPFGGARASGTNDKAGEKWNLLRWISVRTIKETFVPLCDFGYPYMGDY